MKRTIWLMAFGLAACAPKPSKTVTATGGGVASNDAAETKDVEDWRKGRIERLQKEGGWLSLVGLAWLKEGPNRVGSDPSSEVRLPDSTPKTVGTITLSGETVTFAPAPGVTPALAGKPVTAPVTLKTDKDPEVDADKLTIGTVTFYPIWRHGKIGVRATDTQAPARVSFPGSIDHWPVDPAWKITATFVPYAAPKKIEVPTVIPGLSEEYPVPGKIVFTKDGKEVSLEPVIEPGETDWFLIFADETTGKESYPAGRFLYASPAKDGKVVLDFNKAYNPPCAFSPWATCPLPPDENRLPIAITAGEKKFGHH